MSSKLNLTVLFVVIVFLVQGTKLSAEEESIYEQAVCGKLREPIAFWLWQRMAGLADKTRVSHIKNIQPIEFKTRDGIILGGYKLAAHVPRGYILVAQGNAMLVDQIAADFEVFRKQGFDVYLYDYRGYGLSEGNSRLAAIISDYSDIVAHLNTLGYNRHFIYGISIGGVMLLNAVGRNHNFDAAVIDSSPSYISNYGCPESYNPMRHLPKDSSHIMIISGVRDLIVSPAQMAELIRIGKARGAYVYTDIEFSHPFQDKSSEIHRRRLNAVIRFFMKNLSEQS